MEKKCKKQIKVKVPSDLKPNKAKDITLSGFLKVDNFTSPKTNVNKNLTDPTNSNEIVSIFDTTNIRLKKGVTKTETKFISNINGRKLRKLSPNEEKQAKIIKELIIEMEQENCKERSKRIQGESCDSSHFGKIMDLIDKDKEKDSPSS